MTPSVGHFLTKYLPLTQTFVYQYLTNHQKYDPFVCAKIASNTNRFPFEPRYVFTEKSSLNPLYWIHGGLEKFDIRGLNKSYFPKVIKQENPDVLHAHFGPIGAELVAHRRPERPLITSFYGYDASQLVEQESGIRAKYRDLFTSGDLFLVEGPAMQQKLMALGCPERKIGLQRIAIDVDRIEPRYPSIKQGIRVLMVGRFVEKKGIPDGIRAFGEALEGVDGAELRIVGGGGEYDRSVLREIATEAGVSEQVTFTGMLPYEDYLTEVHNCDLLLAPSKRAESGDSEGGAPTVLLEAQASGKPVIATTHADIPYVVEDGVSGKLVQPGDVGALADEINWARNNPAGLVRMGTHGRENMKRRHDVTKLARELEDRYDRLQ